MSLKKKKTWSPQSCPKLVYFRESPWGPVVRSPPPTAGSPGSVPGWSTEIPYAVLCGQKKRTNSKKKIKIFQKTNHKHCWSYLSICIWCSLLYSFSLSDFLVVLPTLKWMLGSLALIHSECVLIQWRSLWQMHLTGWCEVQGRKRPVSRDPLGMWSLVVMWASSPAPGPLPARAAPFTESVSFLNLHIADSIHCVSLASGNALCGGLSLHAPVCLYTWANGLCA